MTFAMPEFRKKKQDLKIFVSPSFYTSPNGYHMAVRVDTNGTGSGKNTHVSVSFPILEGKYDTELYWPFVGDVEIILLNQLQDKNHYKQKVCFTVSADKHARKTSHGSGVGGITKFIRHSALDPEKNTQYLKDDTLYFRVSVEVAQHKPWLQCGIDRT